MARIDLKNCVIKIKDGTTPTANEITVKVGDGTLNYTTKNNYDYRRDRGLLDEVVAQDEEPVDITLDATLEFVRGSGSVVSIEDALDQVNNASTWVTVDSDPCQPYAVILEVVHTPICDSVDIETIVFNPFRADEVQHDLKEGTLSIRGRANVTRPTVTRTAQP